MKVLVDLQNVMEYLRVFFVGKQSKEVSLETLLDFFRREHNVCKATAKNEAVE